MSKMSKNRWAIALVASLVLALLTNTLVGTHPASASPAKQCGGPGGTCRPSEPPGGCPTGTQYRQNMGCFESSGAAGNTTVPVTPASPNQAQAQSSTMQPQQTSRTVENNSCWCSEWRKAHYPATCPKCDNNIPLAAGQSLVAPYSGSSAIPQELGTTGQAGAEVAVTTLVVQAAAVAWDVGGAYDICRSNVIQNSTAEAIADAWDSFLNSVDHKNRPCDRVQRKIKQNCTDMPGAPEATPAPTPAPTPTPQPTAQPVKYEYRFKNGDKIEKAPNVPLKDLFRPTANQVADRLAKGENVIATGTSGIGKTQMFAERDYRAGGIQTVLDERGVKSMYDNAAILHDKDGCAMFHKDWVEAGSPRVVILDESLQIGKEGMQEIAALYRQGVKFVFMGGGSGSTASQTANIQAKLAQGGLPPASSIPIPAYSLTPVQVGEMRNSGTQAVALAQSMESEGIPLTFLIANSIASRAAWGETEVELLKAIIPFLEAIATVP